MPIDPTSMDALLSRINTMREAVQSPALRAAAGLPGVAGAKAAAPADFAAALKSSLDRVDGAQVDAEKLAQRFQLGDPKVSLEETMVSMSKANLSFQQLVQVRNRMVAAYHEVMNMQI
jgi:flagellar hook-basal body complex protein FliE